MKILKVVLVIIGAVIITALGIDAADTLQGSKSTLLSQVISSNTSVCPAGMAHIEGAATLTCIDIYEVSTGASCPVRDPQNIIDSRQNVETVSCSGVSSKDAIPWRFVAREQAVQICAKRGLRLPTAGEWYQGGAGYIRTDEVCNVNSDSLKKTGESVECVSPLGVYDMVGNVWEWVSDDVINGTFNSRELPATGYVGQVDSMGIATLSLDSSQILFGGDYFWSDSAKIGSFGIIRGGYYGSGADAGVYSVHADTLPTASGVAIGFRCVK